ncbi:MAG: hypothetical protein SVE93_03125 [Candidatus Thermoplasmatota archaeon]|nr:hypothetical protein [Candidatus Thermoplasmatota archaeon]
MSKTSLREILSCYNANQLNHLVGTKWGIRFKGKGDYVQFYIEKLSMDSYIRGVLRKLSDDEIDLLRVMVIKGEPVSEEVLKKVHESYAFVGAITTLMSYFLVYSCGDQYYVPEELIDPLKSALDIEEKKFAVISDVSKYVVKGDLAYDLLAILWFGATNGIELTQRDEPQKYSTEKILQTMNSSDEYKEAKLRTFLRCLFNKGVLCRRGNRLATDIKAAEKLLKGSERDVMSRLVSECDTIATLSHGSYTFRQIKDAADFLNAILKLERNRWYEVGSTIEGIKTEAIKAGDTGRWVSADDIDSYILFLSWLGFISLAESREGKKALRVEFEDGEHNNRNADENGDNNKIGKKFIIINPNFEVTIFLDKADLSEALKVMCCGNVEHVDVATRVQLNRDSIILASSYIDNAVAYLKKLSMKPIPHNIEVYIKEWLSSKKTAVLKRATLMFVNKKSYLDELTIKYPEELTRLSPKVAIIDEKMVEKLKKEGYLLN